MTDQQLIGEIKNGNDSAFRELVLRYEAQVAATIIRMVGNRNEADDIGQEVFIRFYNSMDNFKGNSSLATYLIRIAINLSLNAIKSRKRRNLFVNRFVEADESVVENNDLNENVKLVQTAIGKLDAKHRAVIVLRLFEGYSTKEVAEILSIPMGTVLSRLARAQKKLKTILSPYF